MIQPKYPVYVPSRDRYQADRRLTIKALLRDDVPFRVVVVPSQVQHYAPIVGEARLLVLPDDDYVLLGTRNWIRDHAEAEGYARHWQLDDNIVEFRRLWRGRRIPCHAGVALRVCEDFSDRFENVGVSGLNYQMFVPAETPVPYYANVHVYSATLVGHAMPCRWRLIYNDDTDLCLQALAAGWATILLNAFMANKMRTMAISGGNTDQLYQGDGRLKMARALEEKWPRIVSTRSRFGRAQHVVRWDHFADVPLIPRTDFDRDALAPVDEYGLRLRATKDVRSPALRALLADWDPSAVQKAGELPPQTAAQAEPDAASVATAPPPPTPTAPTFGWRMSAEEILRQRERFHRARELMHEGEIEEARRVWWWPRSSEFPQGHWSEKMPTPCHCGKDSPEGHLAFCRYCGGRTSATPSLPSRS